MTVFPRLLLLILTVPAIELFVLVWVGERVGLFPTLALIVATALIGTWLARRAGLAVFTRVQKELAQGRVPGDALLDGLVILISGVLLLTPGILTDLVGFAGLIPATRKRIGKVLRKRLSSSIQQPGPVQFHTFGGAPRGQSGWQSKPPDNEDGTGVMVK